MGSPVPIGEATGRPRSSPECACLVIVLKCSNLNQIGGERRKLGSIKKKLVITIVNFDVKNKFHENIC